MRSKFQTHKLASRQHFILHDIFSAAPERRRGRCDLWDVFALGFTLIFGVLHVLNLAHGAVFMWGAMVGLFAVTVLDLPLPTVFALAVLASGLISVAVDFLAFRPLRRRGNPEFSAIVTSIRLSQILMSLAQFASETQIHRFPFGTFPIKFYSFA